MAFTRLGLNYPDICGNNLKSARLLASVVKNSLSDKLWIRSSHRASLVCLRKKIWVPNLSDWVTFNGTKYYQLDLKASSKPRDFFCGTYGSSVFCDYTGRLLLMANQGMPLSPEKGSASVFRQRVLEIAPSAGADFPAWDVLCLPTNLQLLKKSRNPLILEKFLCRD